MTVNKSHTRWSKRTILWVGLGLVGVLAVLVIVGVYRTTSGGPQKVERDLSALPLSLQCEIKPYATPDADFGETNLRAPYVAQSAGVQGFDNGTVSFSVAFRGVLPSGPRETSSARLGTFLLGSDFAATVLLQGSEGHAISVDRDPGSPAGWSFTETTDGGT